MVIRSASPALLLTIIAGSIYSMLTPARPVTLESAKQSSAPGDCVDGHAFVPANVVNRSRTLAEKVIARAIENPAWFATICPVPLTNTHEQHPECIDGAEEIPLQHTELSITQDPQNPASFRVSLKSVERDAPLETFDMTAFHFGPQDSQRSVDMLRGNDDKERRFFVFFEDSLPRGTVLHSQKLLKKYWIEVFYQDPRNPGKYLCESHMPDHDVSDTEKEAAHAPHFVQGGVGGGTEPRR